MGSQTKTYQHFSEVPKVNISRSSFDRSHGLKTTMDAGLLYPLYWDKVVAGDTINIKDHVFARLATPITPVMDNLYMDLHYFFVPERLLWVNFEKFYGANPDGTWANTNTYLRPVVNLTTEATSLSLWDYLGIKPAASYSGVSICNIAGRSYNKIFNDWYRDQNVMASIPMPTGDGPDTATDFVLRRRFKRKDYFTSALPQPQKGPAVTLPLGTRARVAVDVGAGSSAGVYSTVSGTVNTLNASTATVTTTVTPTGSSPGSDLYADLSTATSATINSLRMALQLQVLYERDARGGTRLVEVLKAHFGVTSPDYRLQRAEYLGGTTKQLTTTPIAQTGPTTAGVTPQGNLAAYGVIADSGHNISQSFTEPGIFMVIGSVRADLNYQQGLARKHFLRTRFEDYWPALANIGEQAILTKEIYCDGAASSATNDTVLGYNERYAELRYNPNEITGLMRSDVSGSLDVWHLAQDFASAPTLNTAFLQEDPPVDRVIATPTQPHFLVDIHWQERWERPLPTFGVPGLGSSL